MVRGIYEIGIGPYIYVGQAEVITRRQTRHLSLLKRGKHFNAKMQSVFNKYGLAEGWFRVLEVVPESDDLLLREQYWFDVRVAEHGRQRVMNAMRPERALLDDPAVRERQQRAIKEVHADPVFIRKLSERASQQIRDQHADPVFAAALSDRMRKRHEDPGYTEKTKQATRAANARTFRLKDPNGRVHNGTNISEFCKAHRLDHSAISRVLYGKAKHHKGWTLAD